MTALTNREHRGIFHAVRFAFNANIYHSPFLTEGMDLSWDGVLRSYVTYLVVGLLVGAAVAPMAMSAADEPEPTVAVIPLEGSISGGSAADTIERLREARANESIQAVVLVINSGGGAASASEELYLQVKRTANQMPVVTAVEGVAASGAYYAALPSDRIYVKPSSIVGSVGVLATAPTDFEPNDVIGATGPNKLSGYDQREFKYSLERLQEAFLGAVIANRGDQLSISESEVAQARVWVGAEAITNGLADSVGGTEAAIRYAASEADLDNYRSTQLETGTTGTAFLSQAAYLASDDPRKRLVSPWKLAGNGGVPVYLMVPAGVFEESRRDGVAVFSATSVSAEGVTNESG
jgi:protease-4